MMRSISSRGSSRPSWLRAMMSTASASEAALPSAGIRRCVSWGDGPGTIGAAPVAGIRVAGIRVYV